MLTADGGPTTAAAAATIQVTIDKIEAIAKGAVAKAEDAAATSSTTFKDLQVHRGSFSQVPIAQDIADMHQAAHDVFTSTVEGVVADLRDFREKLLASARAHEGTDDGVYATLVSVGRHYGADHRYHAQSRFDRERTRHERELGDGQEHTRDAGGPADPGTGPTGGGQDQNATSTPAPGDDHGAQSGTPAAY